MLNNNSNYMYRMKLNRHPIIWTTQVLFPWLHNQAIVEMSKYYYVPQSFNDYRFEFQLPLHELNENNLFNMLLSLEPDYELALHSKIIINNKIFHLPMIDLGLKSSISVASEPIKELCRYWNIGFNIYESGRSFHAYGNRLLTQEEWLQFMGSLLLLNKPSGYKLVDERWIGHRIMAGYSALRWSKNTSHYKKYPTHCGYVSGDDFVVSPDRAVLLPPPHLRGPI
ncbi:primase 1D-like protein [Proteus terrae]|uniref:primase 1D-like protein n=1 Tax=Proteus terrae TaxID=1574161 RepID=UPI00288AD6E8|nr:hypothetical protein [Proteus terrae]